MGCSSSLKGRESGVGLLKRSFSSEEGSRFEAETSLEPVKGPRFSAPLEKKF